jgi:hypothetical protein
MSTRALKITVTGAIACALCLLGSGCTIWGISFDPLQDHLDDRAYKKDVKRYEKNGFDENTAQRKASENRFFRDLERSREER